MQIFTVDVIGKLTTVRQIYRSIYAVKKIYLLRLVAVEDRIARPPVPSILAAEGVVCYWRIISVNIIFLFQCGPKMKSYLFDLEQYMPLLGQFKFVVSRSVPDDG